MAKSKPVPKKAKTKGKKGGPNPKVSRAEITQNIGSILDLLTQEKDEKDLPEKIQSEMLKDVPLEELEHEVQFVRDKPHGKTGSTGLPTNITKEQIAKLKYAYTLGCPDVEAAYYSGLTVRQITYLKSISEMFGERIKVWQSKFSFRARHYTNKNMETNPTIAKECLFRKNPKEFKDGVMQEISFPAAVNISIKGIDPKAIKIGEKPTNENSNAETK